MSDIKRDFASRIEDEVKQEANAILLDFDGLRGRAVQVVTIMRALSMETPESLELLGTAMSDDIITLARASSRVEARTEDPDGDGEEPPFVPLEDQIVRDAPPTPAPKPTEGTTRRTVNHPGVEGMPEHLRNMPGADANTAISVRIVKTQRLYDLLQWINQQETVIAWEAAQAFPNITAAQIGTDLRDLAQAGLILATGKTRHNPAELERRRAAKEGLGRPAIEYMPKSNVVLGDAIHRGVAPDAKPSDGNGSSEQPKGARTLAVGEDHRISGVRKLHPQLQGIVNEAWLAGANIEKAGEKHVRVKMPDGQSFMVPVNPSSADVTLTKSKARRVGLLKPNPSTPPMVV